MISPDDPWAATLLPRAATREDAEVAAPPRRRPAPAAAEGDGLGWALTGDVAAPELPIHPAHPDQRGHRYESLWDARSRSHRHQHRWEEIARDRREQGAAAAERRGENLCEHGVGGADPTTGHSHRCSYCRATTNGTP